MAEELTKGPDEIYCPECGRTIERGLQGCPLCYADFRKIFSPGESTDIPSQDTSYNQDHYQPDAAPLRKDEFSSDGIPITAIFAVGVMPGIVAPVSR